MYQIIHCDYQKQYIPYLEGYRNIQVSPWLIDRGTEFATIDEAEKYCQEKSHRDPEAEDWSSYGYIEKSALTDEEYRRGYTDAIMI